MRVISLRSFWSIGPTGKIGISLRSFQSNISHVFVKRVFLLREVNTKFEIEWRGQRVALKASNGKYLCTKKNGQLSAVSDAVGRYPEGKNNKYPSASVGAAA